MVPVTSQFNPISAKSAAMARSQFPAARLFNGFGKSTENVPTEEVWLEESPIPLFLCWSPEIDLTDSGGFFAFSRKLDAAAPGINRVAHSIPWVLCCRGRANEKEEDMSRHSKWPRVAVATGYNLR